MFGIDTSGLMPHGHCIRWKPELLLPIVGSDILIFLSYTTIPIALYIFYKKRKDLNFSSKLTLFLFFLFIQLCGITHLISAYNYWNSEYGIEMVLKVLTALVSVATAVSMFFIVPQLIKLPSREEHLKLIDELRRLNKELEDRVSERTKELNEQKNLLKTVLEGMPGAIMRYVPIFGSDGEIKDFKTRVLVGKASEEAGLDHNIETNSLVKTYPEVMTDENNHFNRCVHAYTNNETIIDDPMYFSRTRRYFRTVHAKKEDSDSLFVYFSDVTQREYTKAMAQNNARLISLGELAGGISHEINSPLQVLNGKTRQLKRSLKEPSEEQLIVFDELNETISKISHTIQNLKRLSRGDVVSLHEIEVKKILLEIFSLFEQRLKNHDINLKIGFSSENDISIVGNEVSISQIINNIISNAIYALKGIDGPKEINVSLQEDEDKVFISLENNGPLIKEVDIEHIFEPYFTTKEVGQGTGIGLSLSKKLAAEMKGDLQVFQDKNVCFQLYLSKA
tara:strand:- start:616 stop:2136 length:1521 start_codon:yes stop_codon:yes gene_type:complete